MNPTTPTSDPLPKGDQNEKDNAAFKLWFTDQRPLNPLLDFHHTRMAWLAALKWERKKSDPSAGAAGEWRMLEVGEKLQEGDEAWNHTFNTWSSVPEVHFGVSVYISLFRRPIQRIVNDPLTGTLEETPETDAIDRNVLEHSYEHEKLLCLSRSLERRLSALTIARNVEMQRGDRLLEQIDSLNLVIEEEARATSRLKSEFSALTRAAEPLRRDKERLDWLVAQAKAPNWYRDWPMLWELKVYLNASNHEGEEPDFIKCLDAEILTAANDATKGEA